MVQWLGLCTFTAEGLGSIPGRGTKFPRAEQNSLVATVHLMSLGECEDQLFKWRRGTSVPWRGNCMPRVGGLRKDAGFVQREL